MRTLRIEPIAPAIPASLLASLFASLGASLGAIAVAQAQPTAAAVFAPTPDTIAVWSLDNIASEVTGAATNGAMVPDLSGNGLHATIEGNENGDLTVAVGDGRYAAPGLANGRIRRGLFTAHQARIAVNNDQNAFEMGANDDFTLELYVEREALAPGANWGILAGTWHSRNLIDDAGDPNIAGAWYGYGLIRHEDDGGFATGGWRWVLSPVENGQPRVGHGNGPEQYLAPGFEIPAGLHYVVLSVDRTTDVAIGYVDGLEVQRLTLGDNWAFTTPAGRDHARFLMFSGEDDASRGAYRGAPAGVSLDAVRVSRAALSASEVAAVWRDLSAGVPNPASDPVVYLDFETGVAPATPATAPAFGSGRIGARALTFDGAQSLGLAALSSGEMTIALWLRPDLSTPATALETLVANSDAGYAASGFRFFMNSYHRDGVADRRIHFETGNGTAGATAASPPGIVEIGEWSHVAVVVNRAAGRAAIYRNGVNVSESDAVRTDFQTTAAWDIGKMGTNGLHLSAAVDDVRIYDRVVTPAEIERLIPPPPEAPLIASIAASRNEAYAEQCFVVRADTRRLRDSEQVTGVQWRIDADPYTAGALSQEMSMATSGELGVRVTTDAARTATASIHIEVRPQPLEARIRAIYDGEVVGPGTKLVVGSRVALDATTSASQVPAGVLACPLHDAIGLAPSPIVSQVWTIGTASYSEPQVVLTAGALGAVDVKLEVTNASGSTAVAQMQFEVVTTAGPTPDATTTGTADAGFVSDPLPGESSCRCVSSQAPGAAWWWLLAAALVGLRRRDVGRVERL